MLKKNNGAFWSFLTSNCAVKSEVLLKIQYTVAAFIFRCGVFLADFMKVGACEPNVVNFDFMFWPTETQIFVK
jgi:hypothetical protein